MMYLISVLIAGSITLISAKLLGIDVQTWGGLILFIISLILTAVAMAEIAFNLKLKKCPKCNCRKITHHTDNPAEYYYTCDRCKHEFYPSGKAHRINTYI